ncbi:unnamed protein product [Victoria cruziana]
MLGPTSMRIPIDSLGGIAGTGQMSMLGQTLNRTSMVYMQRAPMAAMGPPKIPATNFYMNQHLQQPQQMQMLQQQQLSSPHQQSLVGSVQQQQLSSPHQQSLVGSVQQQVSSPSGLTVQKPNKLAVPAPATETVTIATSATDQSATVRPADPVESATATECRFLVTQQQTNVAGPGTGPASPQLISQTMGSVGSITSSPIDLQGGSKSNSNINAN